MARTITPSNEAINGPEKAPSTRFADQPQTKSVLLVDAKAKSLK